MVKSVGVMLFVCCLLYGGDPYLRESVMGGSMVLCPEMCMCVQGFIRGRGGKLPPPPPKIWDSCIEMYIKPHPFPGASPQNDSLWMKPWCVILIDFTNTCQDQVNCTTRLISPREITCKCLWAFTCTNKSLSMVKKKVY